MRADADPKRRQAVAQVIGRGATLIRQRGWCIGALGDDSGRLCLMGAIRHAARDDVRTIRYAAYDEVNARLGRDMAQWNDEQTDGARVADLLDAVARDLDPAYAPIELCWHGQPVCPDCKSAIGCWSEDFRHGRWPQHRPGCREAPR